MPTPLSTPEPTSKRHVPRVSLHLVYKVCVFLVMAVLVWSLVFVVVFWVYVFAANAIGSRAAIPFGVIMIGVTVLCLAAFLIFKQKFRRIFPAASEAVNDPLTEAIKFDREALLTAVGGIVLVVAGVVFFVWVLISAVHWFWKHPLF